VPKRECISNDLTARLNSMLKKLWSVSGYAFQAYRKAYLRDLAFRRCVLKPAAEAGADSAIRTAPLKAVS
jgi:hypothetical protein